MIRLKNGLLIEGSVFSLPQHKTPQWIEAHGITDAPPNGDYAAFTKEGLFIADGVGKEHMPWVASQVVVKAVIQRADQLRIREMPMDEALNAIPNDVLPYGDFMIKLYVDDHPEAVETSTTLEGLFIVRNGFVLTGSGDSLTLEWKPSQPLEFSQLTREQELGGMLANRFDGKGRPEPGIQYNDARNGEPLPMELTHDEIHAVHAEPGNIYLMMTDGVFGNAHAATRLPQTPHYFLGNVLPSAARTAKDAAQNLVTLPYRISMNTNLVVWDGQNWVPYLPPKDDATAGVLRVYDPKQLT
ncbi:MAG TPA: hypothetical protein VFB59_02670 [Candidatus Saccharimonadales bacterium]|nr:hypothetical protein [Candidatus Saccharimonadales bacterium]